MTTASSTSVIESLFGALQSLAKLLDTVADMAIQNREEQAELRDEVHALANRIEAVARSHPNITPYYKS